MRTRSRHAHLIHMLDRAGMLSSKSPSRAYCEPLKRVARGVAIALVGAMSIGASPIEDALIDADPKSYIRQILNHEQALCLIKLYGKESAFNEYAIGNLDSIDADYAYGIPQLKNPAVAFMSPIEQVNAGIEYIEHRYDSPCHAWAHWKQKGWH